MSRCIVLKVCGQIHQEWGRIVTGRLLLWHHWYHKGSVLLSQLEKRPRINPSPVLGPLEGSLSYTNVQGGIVRYSTIQMHYPYKLFWSAKMKHHDFGRFQIAWTRFFPQFAQNLLEKATLPILVIYNKPCNITNQYNITITGMILKIIIYGLACFIVGFGKQTRVVGRGRGQADFRLLCMPDFWIRWPLWLTNQSPSYPPVMVSGNMNLLVDYLAKY